MQSCQSELDRQIGALQRAVAASPDDHALAECLADKLFIAVRYSEAADIYERLVRLKSPPSPAAFVHLAEIRFQEKKAVEAEGLLRQCLERWPDSAAAHDRLGGIYWRTGRVNAARHHARLACKIEPANVLYQEHCARCREALRFRR